MRILFLVIAIIYLFSSCTKDEIVNPNDSDINPADSIGTDTLALSRVEISLIQSPNLDVLIKWNTLDEGIKTIEVVRSTSARWSDEVIATLTGIDTIYIDHLVPYTDSVYYYINAYTSEEDWNKSNVEGAKGTPLFDVRSGFGYQQAKLLSNDSIIYIRLRSKNRIIGLNYKSTTMQIDKLFSENDGLFEDYIGYFDIANSENGKELYVPNFNGMVHIYELPSFTLKDSLNLENRIESIISDTNGHLFTSQGFSCCTKTPLQVHDRSTLSLIDNENGHQPGRLKLLPSENEIIVISTQVGPADIDYYKFDSSGKFIQHSDDEYHGDHAIDPDIFKIAPSNNYLITSEEGSVFKSDATMSYLGSLFKETVLYFNDFEFNLDGTLIYASADNLKAIYIYDFPNLNKIGEIETKGYPVFLFRKENKLIIISSLTQNHMEIGVEIHQL